MQILDVNTWDRISRQLPPGDRNALHIAIPSAARTALPADTGHRALHAFLHQMASTDVVEVVYARGHMFVVSRTPHGWTLGQMGAYCPVWRYSKPRHVMSHIYDLQSGCGVVSNCRAGHQDTIERLLDSCR